MTILLALKYRDTYYIKTISSSISIVILPFFFFAISPNLITQPVLHVHRRFFINISSELVMQLFRKVRHLFE